MGQFLSRGTDIFYGNHEVDKFNGELESSPAESVRIGQTKTVLESCPKMFNGHRDMIPVSEFTRDCLPEPYDRIDDVYELTKDLAYLTVRITTNQVSEKRPEFLPGTNKECNYPLFDKRGQKEPYAGTGRICDIVTHKNRKCTCENCSKPNCQDPKKNCWTIKVFTATHVVFDNNEATSAKCTLFYGDKDMKKVDVNGFKKIWSDTGGDLCLLSAVTCNQKLSEELFAKIKKFNTHWKALKKMKENDNKKERLVIIVSHPHGDIKRISIGFGLDIGRLQNLGYSKFVYNAPTCPGTSGGPVYILGIDWFGTEYVHGGAITDFTDIEDLVNSHPDIMKQLFPTYLDNTTVTPISYSSLYYSPSTGDTEPPSTGNTEPPSIGDTEAPSTGNTEPKISGDKEPPTTTDTEPPTTGDTEHPTTADTEPPTTADTEPSTTADTEPPTTADTEPPTTGDTEHPTTGDYEPNQIVKTESPERPKLIANRKWKYSNYSARWY